MFRMEFSKHCRDTPTRDWLVASSTERPPQRMIVHFAVGKSFMFEEGPIVERLAALVTNKTAGVPLRIEGRYEVLCDGIAASATFGGVLLKITIFTEGLLVFFMKSILSKLLSAVGAEEVFGMPGLVEGRNAFVQDGSLAVGATWREKMVVVLLAVRPPVSLKEVLCAKFLVTVTAGEVFRVPGVTQCSDHLKDK